MRHQRHYRFDPEFCLTLGRDNMNVNPLLFSRKEIESVVSNAKNRRAHNESIEKFGRIVNHRSLSKEDWQIEKPFHIGTLMHPSAEFSLNVRGRDQGFG